MSERAQRPERGPFYADQLRSKDRYELSDGHAIYCAPTGGDGARRTALGAEVLDTDPAVESAGVDAGFSPEKATLRAPDVSVGVPDKPGWIPGAPPLALEYAGVGQDEPELQAKIVDLLRAGCRHVWVVRLVGPRRVEVYEPGAAMRVLGPGEQLTAPGILRNAVPVEALYDRDKAHELTLRNLLQRRGYESLDAVRSEGREEGREEGRLAALRDALFGILEARGLEVSELGRAQIAGCSDAAALRRWTVRAATAASLDELFSA